MDSSDQYGPALPPGGTSTGCEQDYQALQNMTIMDLSNEANFNALLALPDQEFYPWLSSVGLVGSAETFQCPTCGSPCKFVPRANRRLCFTFRCRNSKNHEFSLTKFSFFEKIKVDVRALLRFLRGYLLGVGTSAEESGGKVGIHSNIRLDWAAVTRDIFVEVIRRSLNTVRFHKEVEINDALVGTLSIDGRNSLFSVWLLGITHTETSQVLLFPILTRDEVSIIRILQRFVDPGSKILTEPGSFYSKMNLHSCGFEGVIRNPLQTVRNSKVWAHTKAHFHKFAESAKLVSFESLVCEIIWRSWKQHGDVLTNYLTDLKSIYTLRGPPQFTSHSRPIFDTWVTSDDYANYNFSFSFVDSAQPAEASLLLTPGGADTSEVMVTTSDAAGQRNTPVDNLVLSSTTTGSPTSSSSGRKVLGPQLPPGLQRSVDSDDLSDEGALTVKMESPSGDTRDSGDNVQDDSVVGPMPSEMIKDGEDMGPAEELERRSKRMKDRLSAIKAEAEEGPAKREAWMTELPPEMGKNFGLQSRTFSKGQSGEDNQDRSIWTETPGSKKEKEGKGKKRKRDEDKMASVREEQMQQQVDEYNKTNRPDSLLDMHTKKQKKKKKKEKKEKKKRKERGEKEEKEARRPFDRERDLQTNRFDDAQRKLIIQKSAALNSRFNSGGSTSSFL